MLIVTHPNRGRKHATIVPVALTELPNISY
jgi:hypothetical protein